jgi:hypothetical protein
LRDCEREDAAEEAKESLVRVPGDLAEAKAMREKVQTIYRELQGSTKKSLNTTDPDAQHMQGRQGTHAGYNVQVVVDDQNGLIVQTDVVDDGNDRQQLKNQIDQASDVLGKPCETACADAGYDHSRQWHDLEEQGVAVVVKPVLMEAPGPFTKDQFQYDEHEDCYWCPKGHRLNYRDLDKKTKHRIYRMDTADLCRRCPHFGVCTTSWTGRSIARIPYEEVRPIVKARYESAEGQIIYARRQGKVEHPFGHIKRNLGVQAFLLRRLAGVRAEAAIFSTCFNIARMMTLVGVGTLLPKLRTS